MNERMDALNIRAASADDIDALAEVYLSAARHHAALDPGFYRLPDRDAVVSSLREALRSDDPATTVRLVAEDDGIVVGSAKVELRSPSPASMIRPEHGAWIDVAVLEGWRGGGIGSRLMEASEAWAREHGATTLMLDASAANTDALRFYQERHGYRVSGVLLRKILASDR